MHKCMYRWYVGVKLGKGGRERGRGGGGGGGGGAVFGTWARLWDCVERARVRVCKRAQAYNMNQGRPMVFAFTERHYR